jgi:hypothetical protein
MTLTHLYDEPFEIFDLRDICGHRINGSADRLRRVLQRLGMALPLPVTTAILLLILDISCLPPLSELAGAGARLNLAYTAGCPIQRGDNRSKSSVENKIG